MVTVFFYFFPISNEIFIETANFTTVCKLIGPGVAVSGLMSITSNEMFFDCNEDDAEFRQQDPRVC